MHTPISFLFVTAWLVEFCFIFSSVLFWCLFFIFVRISAMLGECVIVAPSSALLLMFASWYGCACFPFEVGDCLDSRLGVCEYGDFVPDLIVYIQHRWSSVSSDKLIRQ